MGTTLSHPLAEALAKQDRSASWLSKRCGFDASYAHKVITGLRTPSKAFRERAAELLDVPEADLFPDAEQTVEAA
jgi:hypothetical protein